MAHEPDANASVETLPQALLVRCSSRPGTDFHANGVGIETLAGANATVGVEPTADLAVAMPYPSSAIVPGASYGVSVDVFAANGMTRLAGTAGNVPVDLAAGAATVELTAVVP